MKNSIAIWRLYDGKTGHDRQSEGLVDALGGFLPLNVDHIDVRSIPRAPLLWLRRRFPAGEGLADPQVIVGAGRLCQWPMLAARRARGGRLVYLMGPGLPTAFFDLCLVPAHDSLAASNRVFVTDGALNTVKAATDRDDTRGLVLIGGPSRHYGWDESGLCSQVGAIVEADDLCQWTIADSRRTPTTTSRALALLPAKNADFVSYRDTGPDWIAGRLTNTGRVWVTRDSVSMVFEALTAGAGVGLLSVPAHRKNRLTRLAQDLLDRELVVDYAGWRSGRPLQPPHTPLWEARRCAAEITRRWFSCPPTKP